MPSLCVFQAKLLRVVQEGEVQRSIETYEGLLAAQRPGSKRERNVTRALAAALVIGADHQ